jgi:hypothetical protein
MELAEAVLLADLPGSRARAPARAGVAVPGPWKNVEDMVRIAGGGGGHVRLATSIPDERQPHVQPHCDLQASCLTVEAAVPQVAARAVLVPRRAGSAR